MEKVCISQLKQLSAKTLREGKCLEVVERKPFAQNGDGEEQLIGFFIVPKTPYVRDQALRIALLSDISPY